MISQGKENHKKSLEKSLHLPYNRVVINPGVAQLVARQLWELDVVRSSRTTRTKGAQMQRICAFCFDRCDSNCNTDCQWQSGGRAAT